MSRQAYEERTRGFLTAPFLALSACFALGIAGAGARHVSLAETISIVPLLLAAAGACMLAGLIFLHRRRETFAGVLALGGFILAGAAAARLFEFRYPPQHVSHLEDLGLDLRDPVRISGRLVSSPLETRSGQQFDLELTGIEDRGQLHPLSGKVRLWLRRGADARSLALEDALHLRYGGSIRALAELERPRVYRDPGVFNFRRWMESIHDIYWMGTIKSPLLVEKLPRRGPPSLGELLARVRQKLLAGIDRLYPPWSVEGKDGAVLKAVLLGDRSSLDSDTLNNFRQTGLYHLLVISGLHVGLLAMLAAMLLRLFPLGESWRSVLVLAFLLGYCSLVEQRAPTLRATIMIAAYLLARFFYRRHAALNAVGLAAFLLLIVRPAWLFEAGFELSFAAALLIVGLIVPILERTTEPYRRALRGLDEVRRDDSFHPRLAQWRLDVRRVAEHVRARLAPAKAHPAIATGVVTLPLRAVVWVADILLFTAILQIGLMLPLAETFHRVTYVGIGLNALAIPVMVVLLALAIPTVLLSVVWPALAVWPAKLVALLMSGLFALTNLPHLPAWLSYRVASPPVWVAWGFALAIVLAAWTLGRRVRLFWTSVAGAVIFALLISLDPFPPRLPSGRLEITVLDCGRGDSFFAVLPDRTTMLVDAGGADSRGESRDPFEVRRWDAGEDIVSPYLWSRGVKKLDVVVMGRGGEGRLASLASVARNFRIGEFWHSSNHLPPLAMAFLDELERRGVRLRAVAAGDLILRGPTAIQILWPRARGEETPASDSSDMDFVAMRIANGPASVFLAGEMPDQAQRALLKSGLPLAGRLLVLAGTDSSFYLRSDFLEQIAPQAAFLSGEDDASGLSRTPASLASASGLAAPHFHTDLEGALTGAVQGRQISVHAYGMPAGEGTFGLEVTNSGRPPSSRSVR
jgi:competence protein ComEC